MADELLSPGPPRLRRREPADVRREQILDAAAQVLLSRGLGAATVAEVAEAAGLGKGTVYLYFPSKAEILAGLRARYLERFASAVTGGGSPSIEAFVTGLFDFSTANRELHHLLFHEAGFSEDNAFARARDVLEQLVVTGGFAVPDPPLAAGFLLHGLHGLLVSALHSPDADRGRYIDAATDLARRVLGTAGSPS